MMNKEESSLTAGKNGPVLLQDIQLIDKLTRFVREKIPERVVFAKGTGAHGYFRAYMPMSDFTKAAFLQNPDRKIPVFVRFSTMTGSKGSADTLRDVRGFAVKFYTTEGNYDLVSTSLPVFYIRDAIHFPELMHALKPSPSTNLIEPARFWKYISETPEATHMTAWLFSDNGTIKSYRHMEGYSVNTYVWVSSNGQRQFARYHWKPMQGIKNITRQEAEFLAGFDPDAAARDLCDSLEGGELTEYELNVQLIPFEKQEQYDFDPLDATKLWPENIIPLLKVGKLTLNKATENYFEEVEKAAFSPANIVPGIEFSFDRLLQGGIFASLDAQRHRLGSNFEQFSINQTKYPITEVVTQSRIPSAVHVEGNIERNQSAKGDDFSQAGERYRTMSTKEQDHLVDNIIDHMMFVDDKIQRKAVGYFINADEEFGARIARGLDF
ncbi:MAG TPA: catalase [Anaerovoracaceae bacterium]|nr:catalase [Anaerovoracaceae bacterium]